MKSMGFIQSASNKIKTSSILVPETFTHSIAFGQTGSGKTTSYIYPNLQERIRLGHGILLYDYKGKEHLSVKYLANDAQRLEDVIEIGKPWGESINIIENMGEEDFDRFFDNILHHSDDNKFWQNSAKSLGQSVLKILKEINAFTNAMRKINPSFIQPYIVTGNFTYPTPYTLTSLVNVTQTFEKLSRFIGNLDALLSKTYTMMQDNVQRAILNNQDIDAQKSQYAELIRTRERLIASIKETSDSLEGVGKDSNENLTQNIIGSLISPLLSLSQNRFFNENQFDIAEALNQGKIIIINSESLSDSALESLNNVILNELSKRTRNIHNNPISIFIDEAQRVLSPHTDLPIDVLRESKVDIFLTAQNSALLKNKLTEEHFDALIGNLTYQFYFKNSDKEALENNYNLTELECFEYLCSEDNFTKIHLSQALHVSLKKRLKVELNFQKQQMILDDFAYPNRDKPIILDYDSKLYKNSELISTNIDSLTQTIVRIESEQSLKHMESEINSLFETAIEELNADDNLDDEYEYFEDEEDPFKEAS